MPVSTPESRLLTMCGIAGFFSPNGLESDLITRMSDIIAHRGPDDSGAALWKTLEAPSPPPKSAATIPPDLPSVTEGFLSSIYPRTAINLCPIRTDATG